MAQSFWKNKKKINMDPKEQETIKKEEVLIDENLETSQENSGNPQEEEATKEQEAPAQEEKTPTAEQLLAQQLEEANKKIEEQNDKYLRLSAEFDNYRKRTMKEKAELIKSGGEKSISSILPIIDDMERALQTMETSTDVTAIKDGLELIYNKFIVILGQNGAQVIESKEKEFNTDYHEAIATIPAPSEELKGKILDCVQAGYLLNGKVIRHAKVVVGE